MSTPTQNPISFRLPFESQMTQLPAEHQHIIRTTWNAITDLQGAVPLLKSQLDSLKTTTTSTTSGTGSGTNVTENITNITNNILGFTVSDQSGNTAYTVQQSDNTAILILNDASPVAVTLDTTLTIPYGCIPVNQGAGLVTLTPSSGTINGLASLTLADGYFALLALDGTNWFAAVLPTVPVTFTPVAHEFLTGYDSSSGAFSAAQPAFTDISGVAAPSQIPTPTASTIGGVEAIGPVASEWINEIDTSGVPHLSQPAFSDVSGQIAPATQMPASGVTAGSYTNGNFTVDAEGLVTAASSALSGTTGSLGGSAMTAGQTISATATITGATTSMVAVTSPQTYPGDAFQWQAYVSAADTVTVTLTAVLAGTPVASLYNVRVLN